VTLGSFEMDFSSFYLLTLEHALFVNGSAPMHRHWLTFVV